MSSHFIFHSLCSPSVITAYFALPKCQCFNVFMSSANTCKYIFIYLHSCLLYVALMHQRIIVMGTLLSVYYVYLSLTGRRLCFWIAHPSVCLSVRYALLAVEHFHDNGKFDYMVYI